MMNAYEQKTINLLKMMLIPRADDLPYWDSPPVQFIYQSTATLSLGRYIWSDSASPLTTTRPIQSNGLYFFRNITLTADIAEFDFTLNLVISPQFLMYRVSDALAPLFREPILMNKFYQQFEYPLWWHAKSEEDQLRAAFITGQVDQGANLIGKNSVTLKAIISAQEVLDENYIQHFMSTYPHMPDWVRQESIGDV